MSTDNPVDSPVDPRPAVPLAWGILSALDMPSRNQWQDAEINLAMAAAGQGYGMAGIFTYGEFPPGYHTALGQLQAAIIEHQDHSEAIFTTNAHPDSLPVLEAMARNAECRLVVLTSGIYPPAVSQGPRPPKTLV
jgi:hypothetical protein